MHATFKPHTAFPVVLATFALWCCGSGDIALTPEDDARALERIARTWSGALGEATFTLSICEDLAANAAFTVDGCTYAHLVQSQDPPAARTIDRASGGCESCFLGVLTNVTATLSKPDGTTLLATGIASLGTSFDEDPYSGDYGLLLYADDALALEGRIQSDGTLILSGAALLNLGFTVEEAEVSFEKPEAATCGEGDAPAE